MRWWWMPSKSIKWNMFVEENTHRKGAFKYVRPEPELEPSSSYGFGYVSCHDAPPMSQVCQYLYCRQTVAEMQLYDFEGFKMSFYHWLMWQRWRWRWCHWHTLELVDGYRWMALYNPIQFEIINVEMLVNRQWAEGGKSRQPNRLGIWYGKCIFCVEIIA